MKMLAIVSQALHEFFSLIKSLLKTIADYAVNRQTKIDDIKLSSGKPVAKKVSKSFQDIVEADRYYFDFYHSDTFKYIKGIQQFVDHFENQRGSFHNEYDNIRTLIDKRDTLNNQLKNARLYLDSTVLANVQKYLDLDKFSWITTTYTDNNTFYLEFFKNIIDEKKHTMRQKISAKVLKNLGKLINP